MVGIVFLGVLVVLLWWVIICGDWRCVVELIELVCVIKVVESNIVVMI